MLTKNIRTYENYDIKALKDAFNSLNESKIPLPLVLTELSLISHLDNISKTNQAEREEFVQTLYDLEEGIGQNHTLSEKMDYYISLTLLLKDNQDLLNACLVEEVIQFYLGKK